MIHTLHRSGLEIISVNSDNIWSLRSVMNITDRNITLLHYINTSLRLLPYHLPPSTPAHSSQPPHSNNLLGGKFWLEAACLPSNAQLISLWVLVASPQALSTLEPVTEILRDRITLHCSRWGGTLWKLLVTLKLILSMLHQNPEHDYIMLGKFFFY